MTSHLTVTDCYHGLVADYGHFFVLASSPLWGVFHSIAFTAEVQISILDRSANWTGMIQERPVFKKKIGLVVRAGIHQIENLLCNSS